MSVWTVVKLLGIGAVILSIVLIGLLLIGVTMALTSEEEQA